MMFRLLFCLALAAWSSERIGAGVFDDANRLYEQKRYAEAIPLYQNLLKSRHYSPGVLFNLGNAYYKNGELGQAILHYHRAQRIAPRDPDVQANLRFARNSVSGSISVQPGLAGQLLRRFTLNEIAGITVFLYWVWLGLLCFMRWRPSALSTLRSYAVVAALLTALASVILLVAYRSSKEQIAIVLGPQVTVQLGPMEESQAAFTAPDGTELKVLAQRDEWLQVADRSGRTGWLKSSTAAVFPES